MIVILTLLSAMDATGGGILIYLMRADERAAERDEAKKNMS